MCFVVSNEAYGVYVSERIKTVSILVEKGEKNEK